MVRDTLLMLPGLLCDARIFANQQAAVPGAMAIDGFGPCTSLAQMAERVLEAAPPRMALLGHSMGARVALEVVRRAPERVTRLALVSTGVHAIQPGEADKRHALRDLGRMQGMDALVDAWLPPMIAPANRVPATVDPLARMCRDQGMAVFEAQVTALLGRPEVESLLPGIACPTLVAVGEDDIWSPPVQHRAIAAAIPNATLHVVAGAGHMLPVERPGALNAAIAAWLASPSHPSSTGESK